MNYDYLTSAIKVSVPTYQESKTEPGTIFFSLHLQAKDNKWYVEKRFSEFDQLWNGLKNSYHSLPPLPKKSFLFKMTEKQLELRRASLQEFLRKIIVRNDLMNSELLKQFLQLDKNASELMVNPPKLLVEYAIEGQTKGIRDYFFIEDKNIFLVATADMSPVSKLNAKVTNTKLPWETENGKFMEVGSIEAWQCDLESSKFIRIWSKGYPQEAICLSYDKVSGRILIGLDDGVVDFIKMTETSYEDIVCSKVHSSRVMGVSFDCLTNMVFSVSQDKIFRVSHGSSLSMVIGVPHRDQLLVMVRDHINKRVFIGTKIGQIYIYDISSAEKPKQLMILRNNKGGAIRTLHIDTNRNYLFTGSFDDGEINVFDLDKPGREKLAKMNATLTGKEKVRAVTWSAKRAEIMTGTEDGSVTFWNAIEGKVIYVLQAFDTGVTRLEYVIDRDLLISASKSKAIKIWRLPREWRDAKLVADEQKQASKFINEYNKSKLIDQLDKAKEDSDDDDLAGWHLE